MLEHQKIVLSNVSSNKELFKKELNKSLGWLASYEIYDLYKWLKENYSTTHQDIISEVFSKYAA